MKLLRHAISLFAFVAIAGGSLPALAADAQPAQKEKKEAPKDIVLKGDAKCTECHDENDSPRALQIGKTKHGVTADKRTPTCTNCHGDSEVHIKEAGRGDKKTPPPDVAFGAKSKNTAQQRSQACLTCHQGGKHLNWATSTHASRNVTCTNCHTVHGQHDKVRDKTAQTDVCFKCHKEQRAQINRPSHHPIPEGKMSCSSCHNVHGDNPKQLQKTVVNEVCYTCHMEKRGPFVHNHQPVAEDCSICHNPHGTTVANLLKQRPPYLCQECHSSSSHPGQVAGLPTGRTTQTTLLGTVGRGCLNCHTNIHGGNSTINNATAGRFRR